MVGHEFERNLLSSKRRTLPEVFLVTDRTEEEVEMMIVIIVVVEMMVTPQGTREIEDVEVEVEVVSVVTDVGDTKLITIFYFKLLHLLHVLQFTVKKRAQLIRKDLGIRPCSDCHALSSNNFSVN